MLRQLGAFLFLGLQLRGAEAQAEATEYQAEPAKTDAEGAPPGMEVARLYGNINKYAYYFTDLLIGSPNPQRTSVIVDTGSRLVGFPCRGCEHCGNHLYPAFDVSKSKTARWLECGMGCASGCMEGRCSYRETYSEGSSIAGRWFEDWLELGGSFNQNPPVRARMGCHNNENKLFYTQRANGIMGLAPSNDTTPTVLQDLFQDRKHVSTQIFSMCLATWGGRLTVGGFDSSYHVQGEPIQWTPMRPAHYYFVFPEKISLVGPAEVGVVDSQPLTLPMTGADFGVTIIDSGTTYTYLPGAMYRALADALTSYCRTHDGCAATREGGECWRLWDSLAGPDRFPVVRIHFQGDADVDWAPQNYLHERGEQGVWCETFMENNMFQTVLGISWMLHKDVIFDLAGGRLGLAKADCPEHHKDSDYLQKSSLSGDVLRETQRRPLQPLLAAASLVLGAGALAGWAATLLRSRLRPSEGGPSSTAVQPLGEAIAARGSLVQVETCEEERHLCGLG